MSEGEPALSEDFIWRRRLELLNRCRRKQRTYLKAYSIISGVLVLYGFIRSFWLFSPEYIPIAALMGFVGSALILLATCLPTFITLELRRGELPTRAMYREWKLTRIRDRRAFRGLWRLMRWPTLLFLAAVVVTGIVHFGIASDEVIGSSLASCVWVGPLLIVQNMRKRVRNAIQCATCGYQVPLQSIRCPECGAEHNSLYCLEIRRTRRVQPLQLSIGLAMVLCYLWAITVY